SLAPGSIRLGIFIKSVMTGSPPSNETAIAAANIGPTPSERERVVDLLQLRFAEDRLSLEEFERRVAAAYQTKSATELDDLTADLRQSTTLPVVPEHGRVSAKFSNYERNGPMTIPREFEIASIFGNVEIDMTDATFAAGVTEIRISAVLGNVELTLPLGIRVECAGDALLGNFDCKAAMVVGYPTDEDRAVRISGRAVLASVQIEAELPSSVRLAGRAPRRLT